MPLMLDTLLVEIVIRKMFRFISKQVLLYNHYKTYFMDSNIKTQNQFIEQKPSCKPLNLQVVFCPKLAIYTKTQTAKQGRIKYASLFYIKIRLLPLLRSLRMRRTDLFPHERQQTARHCKPLCLWCVSTRLTADTHAYQSLPALL